MGNKVTIKILVQPKPKAAHREVEVEIDWTGVSAEDMQFLAQQLILHNLQAKIRAGFYDGQEFPEVITVRAEWEIHRDCTGVKDYKIPESWLSGEDKPKPVKKVKKEKAASFSLEEMLKGLSPEDLKALLS